MFHIPFKFVLQLGAAIVFVFVILGWETARYRKCGTLDIPWSPPDLSAGNSTLGFEAILALSQGTKWRVDGLQAAGSASGIKVQVPEQPKWSEPFVTAFLNFGPDARGAAMAWLGHIDLLKLVIQNRWGSALIMEDDMDWDVNIRNQTRLISDAILTLTNQRRHENAPYGLNWDVIWMGHCGDPPNFHKPHVVFKDDSGIPIAKYRGQNRHVTELLKDGERCVYYSQGPICTWGYAVTAEGARKLLAYASLGQGGAFDLMLMKACQTSILNCISVNPQVFDQYHPADGDESEVRAKDKGVSIEHTGGKEMGWTENILRSARCFGQFEKTCLRPK